MAAVAVPGAALHLVGQLLQFMGVGADAVDVGTLRQESRHVARAPREVAAAAGFLEELLSVGHGTNAVGAVQRSLSRTGCCEGAQPAPRGRRNLGSARPVSVGLALGGLDGAIALQLDVS